MYILKIKPVSQQILISQAALRIYYVCQSSFTVHPPAMWQCVQVILNFEKKATAFSRACSTHVWFSLSVTLPHSSDTVAQVSEKDKRASTMSITRIYE